jgi:hypothetical protein
MKRTRGREWIWKWSDESPSTRCNAPSEIADNRVIRADAKQEAPVSFKLGAKFAILAG